MLLIHLHCDDNLIWSNLVVHIVFFTYIFCTLTFFLNLFFFFFLGVDLCSLRYFPNNLKFCYELLKFKAWFSFLNSSIYHWLCISVSRVLSLDCLSSLWTLVSLLELWTGDMVCLVRKSTQLYAKICGYYLELTMLEMQCLFFSVLILVLFEGTGPKAGTIWKAIILLMLVYSIL